MSDLERASALLASVPPYKLRYAIAYLQGLTADEETDDSFCENRDQRYLEDPDRGDFVSLKERAVAILDSFPEDQIGNVIAMLQTMKQAIEDAQNPDTPNAETIAAMQEVNEMIRTGKGGMPREQP